MDLISCNFWDDINKTDKRKSAKFTARKVFHLGILQ